MPKQSLIAANMAANARHGQSGTNAGFFTGKAQCLANSAKHLHFNDGMTGESVTAIGYTLATPGVFYVARNAGLSQNSYRGPLSRRVADAMIQASVDWFSIVDDETVFDPSVVNVNQNFGEYEGFHAEMMIVRHLAGTGLFGPLAYNKLCIGASKTCCPDCSGWMSGKNISHAPLGGAGLHGSKPWRHPLTGAAYAYEGGQVTYYKHPNHESLGAI